MTNDAQDGAPPSGDSILPDPGRRVQRWLFNKPLALAPIAAIMGVVLRMSIMIIKPCLLVVDDEPDLVQSVKDLLRFDYRVLGATRAVEGLALLSREDVAVVMSDQRMPEMTGVEFLKRV